MLFSVLKLIFIAFFIAFYSSDIHKNFYLFPIPCSLFPVPCSLLPTPYSLLPTPYSLLPIPSI
ncbi:hypothetical protein BJP36_42215 [Moorena producens JHB]|uniref:Uncharacterized protein n=1 Tax=Moorena producens (strain JHB) TaxID=1454205 RepID=A0A9Q9SSS3_MOOP1|nr:hypothetical protein [Moorena producens]WAN68978.1 hypothetical protein BJP36_42215 [Moorena producens JHB]